MQSNPRYAGNPLVRLLEFYVLWAIGELPEKEAATLAAMTPKLQSVYSANGSWQDIIAGTVGFGPDVPAHLKELWHRNQDIARQNKVELTPQQFAEMIVDDNLVR